MASISETIFATAFYWMKTFEFAQKSIEVCSLGSNFQKSIIGSANVLFRNRWQAIMWANDGTIHWRICVTWPKWVKWGNALDVSIFYLPVIYQVRYMTWQPLKYKNIFFAIWEFLNCPSFQSSTFIWNLRILSKRKHDHTNTVIPLLSL